MFLEVRILKELRAYFSEVRIPKGLRQKKAWASGIARGRNADDAFELPFVITQRMVTYW
jgi:hypothetical protein